MPFFVYSPKTPADLSQLPSYAARMDDDREAYEFSHALYLARLVDWEAAQMIVQAEKAGQITLREATMALFKLPNPGARAG